MIVKHNIKTYTITWLSKSYDQNTATGLITNYYLPESIDELINICQELYKKKERFHIIGHTSNIYFRPNTNIAHLITTRKLSKWEIIGDHLVCECGVNVKSLTKAMIEVGVEGFAGMIDLPGTIGGAIYGNSSVSCYSISKLIEVVTILKNDGRIVDVSKDFMQYSVRSSILKRKEMEGVILQCKLRLNYGDREKEISDAKTIHKWRVDNQPGPTNNLGTTILGNNYTVKGGILNALAKFICFIWTHQSKANLVLKLMRMSFLEPYLFGYNRFMWVDSKSHTLFSDYLKFVKKMFKNPKLEIEIW